MAFDSTAVTIAASRATSAASLQAAKRVTDSTDGIDIGQPTTTDTRIQRVVAEGSSAAASNEQGSAVQRRDQHRRTEFGSVLPAGMALSCRRDAAPVPRATGTSVAASIIAGGRQQPGASAGASSATIARRAPASPPRPARSRPRRQCKRARRAALLGVASVVAVLDTGCQQAAEQRCSTAAEGFA